MFSHFFETCLGDTTPSRSNSLIMNLLSNMSERIVKKLLWSETSSFIHNTNNRLHKLVTVWAVRWHSLHSRPKPIETNKTYSQASLVAFLFLVNMFSFFTLMCMSCFVFATILLLPLVQVNRKGMETTSGTGLLPICLHLSRCHSTCTSMIICEFCAFCAVFFLFFVSFLLCFCI